MDLTSLVIIAGIMVYVILEYQRREQQHREVLSFLKKGEKPPEVVQKVEGWKLFTTGGMAIILLAVTAVLVRLAVTAHPRYAMPFVVMVSIGVVLAAVVGLMFFRNLALYRSAAHPRKETAR
jgi:preprotein translocase subunit YajC